jgi:hypothetical protein
MASLDVSNGPTAVVLDDVVVLAERIQVLEARGSAVLPGDAMVDLAPCGGDAAPLRSLHGHHVGDLDQMIQRVGESNAVRARARSASAGSSLAAPLQSSPAHVSSGTAGSARRRGLMNMLQGWNVPTTLSGRCATSVDRLPLEAGQW